LRGEEIRRIYEAKGFTRRQLNEIVDTVTSDEERWLDVMMAEELKVVPIQERSVLRVALIVGFAALVGSLIPLAPFFELPVWAAVWSSIVLAQHLSS